MRKPTNFCRFPHLVLGDVQNIALRTEKLLLYYMENVKPLLSSQILSEETRDNRRNIRMKMYKCKPINSPWTPISFETSRLPHFSFTGIRDGGEVVSATRRVPYTPGEIPGTHFC
jgi:hypothetical protein